MLEDKEVLLQSPNTTRNRLPAGVDFPEYILRILPANIVLCLVANNMSKSPVQIEGGWWMVDGGLGVRTKSCAERSRATGSRGASFVGSKSHDAQRRDNILNMFLNTKCKSLSWNEASYI
jgi:hypothetical protein